MATFKNMTQDPKANNEFIPQDLLLKPQIMHKGQCSKIPIVECINKLYLSLTLLYLFCGTVGDWKNTFTVAQKEMCFTVFYASSGT